ncbi:MAG: cyclic dehypoxanthinyl futalosine synthase, partial [Myxococcales bacterium]|nr:cyclic dehypoxanthinyl futalosine synthase [Myxococcales bacterium]
MRRIKLAAVSFLNARPITYGLERGLGESRFDLSFDLPSRCADALRSGAVDLALIPTASYGESQGAIADLRAVPGIAVASFGAVRTVLLVGDVPMAQMTDVALDGASRSSARLLQLLFRARGLTPRYREVAHDEVLTAASGTTGALVIGDAGFEAAGRYPHVVDLGEAWRAHTGLPFVYALWAGPADVLGPEEIALLQQSLAAGLTHRGEIARAWAEAHGGAPALYERYLTDNIRYRLGADELSGAAAYFDRMLEAGMLPARTRVRLFEAAYVPGAVHTAAPSQPDAGPSSPAPRTVDALLSDAAAGVRLSPDDAIRLYQQASTLDLGAAADARRQAL